GWDHHAKIFDSLDKKLPEFDQGFSALVEDMHQRGLMKETLLVCFGEFGRTPKMNKDAGRDHWGPAASLLFAGAGVKPGPVIGAIHDEARRRLGRPLRGVVGSTPEKSRAAAKALNVPRAYDSFDDLVADPVIRVVHLTTPNKLHFVQCRQALLAGKHVLCEKP